MMATGERMDMPARELDAVLRAAPDPVFVVDRAGAVMRVNHAARELWAGGACNLGLAAGGASPPSHPDGSPFGDDELPVRQALRGRTVHDVELVVHTPSARDLTLRASAAPVLDRDGHPAGAVYLLQRVAGTDDVDRLKDQFLNTVSHELRTPTTTIRGGALTLLRRGHLLDEGTRVQLLQDIAEESERLHHLLEDLLSLTRSEAGMHLSPEPVRIGRVADRLATEMAARAGTHAVSCSIVDGLPLVEADPLAVEQIIRNLLTNAMRHSPAGGRVTLSAEQRGDEVLVSVTDQGPGLATSDLDRVFEPFYRPQSTVDAAVQGAGLGLAVCRRLISLSGGRIWAESPDAGGAAFRFTLPAIEEPEG